MNKNTNIDIYKSCPCGSGEKYKFCCQSKGEIQCAEDIDRLIKISENFSEEKKSYLNEILKNKTMTLFNAIEYIDKIDVVTLEEFLSEELQYNDEDEDVCKPEDCKECEDRDECSFDFEKAAKQKHAIQTSEEAEKFLCKLILNGDAIRRNDKYFILPFKV